MPLHHTLASEPSASRRLRRSAPLFLLLGILGGALAPGLIAGDRAFQTGLCDYLEHAPAACLPLAEANGADALSTAVASIADDDLSLGVTAGGHGYLRAGATCRQPVPRTPDHHQTRVQPAPQECGAGRSGAARSVAHSCPI
jgi:hypothetical protein